MANFTLQNMTPGNAADCYLPGCNGVVGGLCVGALPTGANVNQTLWWCCTPTCRGGQSACPGTNCSSGTATWCCNEELESCPGEGGLEGSCVPKNYTNPVLDGPAWGPGASSSVSGSASSSSTSTVMSGSSTSTAPARTTVTESAAPTTSSTATAESGDTVYLLSEPEHTEKVYPTWMNSIPSRTSDPISDHDS
ncbi:hypothetical protein P167DRAFT_550184 [Morchella conica CCBAS932]|uniref:Uncharacterized protein n=1 Tax=Morchella conica CCBAS932 TaxID=1392247 RepID=A0A3N4KC67_9PEZI|nr:hypothetical protein P167DRAFT_550184 [Morchella conica CCBAS932]